MTQSEAAQPSLFDVIAVHCFYGCGHVVREHAPQTAHDAMEDHYTHCPKHRPAPRSPRP